jgi:ABC-type glucose/galactose transport system permease subunit
MTFLAMEDMRDRYFFEEWIDKISDFETNNIAYYDDVAEPIWITIYNEIGQSPTDAVFKPIGGNPESVNFSGKNIKLVEVYEVQLVKAIPTRIEMMQVSWADVDTLLKYSVSFSYESLKIQNYANRSGETFTHLDKVQK